MSTSSPRLNVFGLALVSTVLVVIGCLSTWAHWNGRSFGGTDVNAGKTTLVAAIIAATVLLIATWRAWRWAALAAAVPAGVAAAVAAYRLADVANFVEGGSSDATAGWGLWMATIAACALLALCLVHAVLPKQSAAPESAVPPAVE